MAKRKKSNGYADWLVYWPIAASIITLIAWLLSLVGCVFGAWYWYQGLFDASTDLGINFLRMVVGIASAIIPYHFYQTIKEIV